MMLRRVFFVTAALVLGAVCLAPCHGQDTLQREADRLASLLEWHQGSVVAEIGAGNGRLTTAAAMHVGPSGKVYTNEIDPQALTHLQDLAATDANIVVIKGSAASVNLPAECCDSIFMRLVYHHFTQAKEIDATLLRSLKPGGQLAVIDEEPRPGTTIPDGVPGNRIGHGIPQPILIDELKSAGFAVESVHNDWPSPDEYHRMYCVVFRKANR